MVNFFTSGKFQFDYFGLGEMELLKGIASGAVLALLLTGMLALTLDFQPVGAPGTSCIRANGSVGPATAPIPSDGDVYAPIDDMYNSSELLEADVVVDRQGTGCTNVTIENVEIEESVVDVEFDSFEAPRTICIGADGSVDPSTVPISRVGDVYTFAGDIYGSVVLLKGDVVVDGAGYTLQGTGSGTGIDVTAISSYVNVTIKNVKIREFAVGIELSSFNEGVISGNTITNNGDGVRVSGFGQFSSFNNVISGNTIADNENGIVMEGYVVGNVISGNIIADNGHYGVALITWMPFHSPTEENVISENVITGNGYGVYFSGSSDNLVYHNNFVDNAVQVYAENSANVWDNGYPSGGNYWSDYVGVDANGDGIGDTPYVVVAADVDKYALMNPWSLPLC